MEERAFRSLRVPVAPSIAYWTVVDDAYRPHPQADHFLRHLRLGRDRAEGTTRQYAGELAGYLDWLARTGRDLERGARELSRFALHLRTEPITRRGSSYGRPRSAGRVNHVLTAVREFYRHAAAHGQVLAGLLGALYEVADSHDLPDHLRGEDTGLRYHTRPRHAVRTDTDERPDRATREEWEALLGASSTWRDRFLLTLLWCSGLRIGEALGLRRIDLHLAGPLPALGCRADAAIGAHLHVVPRDNPNRASAKGHRQHVVPVSREVLAVYDRYDLEERQPCPAADASDFVLVNLFHEPRGAPMTYSTVNQLFGVLSRRAGLDRKITPHLLRHAAGSEMADAEVGIDVIQAVLGHRSIASTQRYLHPNDARKREAVERVARRAQERRQRRLEVPWEHR